MYDPWIRLPAPATDIATCPYCAAYIHRTSTCNLVAGVGKWEIVHDEPLCFEWETGRVSAQEVLAAFDRNELTS